MSKQKSNNNQIKKFLLIALAFILVIAICVSTALFLTQDKSQDVSSSEVVVLDSPDPLLMGGWILKNPDNEFELLAFEFGPDSTFIVMNFVNGQQVGEKMTGKCTYLTVKGYKAIEMTLDSSAETMYYFYTVEGDLATFTNKDTGEIMQLQLVKKVTLAE